jgi:predicted Zn-dependent protease
MRPAFQYLYLFKGFLARCMAQRSLQRTSQQSRAQQRTAQQRTLQQRMAALTLAALAVVALPACKTVQTTQPGTVGVTRQQSMMVSSQQIDQASAQSYSQMVGEARGKAALNRDAPMSARVQGIANRLIAQTPAFRPDAARWNWEVNVFQSNEVNAFCMAGGKIGIYSGLITRLNTTDDELAAVIGHEIAHALREHVREAVSRQAGTQLALDVLGVATGSQAISQLGGVVTQVTFGLPRSREAEQEADQIGVELAARAGYDPRAAISLWQKMGQVGGSKPPSFLSTHPSAESRQRDLGEVSNKVMPLYQQAKK